MAIPQYVKNIIKKNDPEIKKIEINSGLFDSDIQELVELLNSNPYITELGIFRNNIGDQSSQTLSQLKYVKNLNVSSNNFSDKGIEPLVLNQNFSHLDLSRNNLSDIGAKFIEANSKQSRINISGNHKISEIMLNRINEKINKITPISFPFNLSAGIVQEKTEKSSSQIEPHFELNKGKKTITLVIPFEQTEEMDIENMLQDNRFAKEMACSLVEQINTKFQTRNTTNTVK